MTAINKQALRYGDNVLWFLNELAAYDASDIDGGEFDVYGEDRNGLEGCSTIDVTELAADAAKLIEAAEKRIAEHNFENRLLANADRDIKALRQRIAELEARAFNPAILDLIAERQRQQSVEGWTPAHDDKHDNNEMAFAASCYAFHSAAASWDFEDDGTPYDIHPAPKNWPWDSRWWKPTSPRCDLVKAGALIIAEIERIDRAAGIGVKGE